ncbi:polysaccharide deacetylase family protein [Sphingobacterium spiritivorum]|uniref:polysaccharide deacetylase family protein n=1 Tax=Sphingobacterium spiritivorum TaxID=258 RepID=UPI003F769E44
MRLIGNVVAGMALSVLVLSTQSCGNNQSSQKTSTVEHQDSVTKKEEHNTEKKEIQTKKDTLTIDSVKKKEPVDKAKLTKAQRDSINAKLDSLPKHIYLTFDDGPLIGSSAIDSIATAKNIKINVFLIGKHANMSKRLKKDYLRYYNNPLVDCYNHSYTHANNKFSVFYSNPNHAFSDFEKNEADLALKYKITRMPGRNIWYFKDRRRIDLQSGTSTADLLYANGYEIMGWDVEWKIHGLTGQPVQSVNEIYQRMKNRLKKKDSFTANNVVLLMHDDMFQNRKGQKLLSDLIDSLKSNPNYHFEHMRDYPVKY